MKLTYWYAACEDDADCYSVIARTKKEAEAERERRNSQGGARFAPVEKRTIEYADGFDLFEKVTAEGGGRGWGYK